MWLLAWVAAMGTLAAQDARPTQAQAERAAQAWVAYYPGDDIMSDYRADFATVADLDGDGVHEIVSFETATCVSANFDCHNQVVVMTPLKPGDRRVVPDPLGGTWESEAKARMREGGYGPSAALHIPGEVTRLEVRGAEIRVSFEARDGSPYCKRGTVEQARRFPCPSPGRHLWRLAWDKGWEARTLRDCEDAGPLDAERSAVAVALDWGCLRRLDPSPSAP
ncbi:hypothetical protein LDO32_00605 [Luteimonas sp. Y-2-2-4F]|nr:hypothetical protein [Luteimonas sp. Y-2-2-4F]MCD9030236.1 hypothetical protein [Luteimonas sp. Y-2-2-4F]